MVFKGLHGLAPEHISCLLQQHCVARPLRSSQSLLLHVPKTRLKTKGRSSIFCGSPTSGILSQNSLLSDGFGVDEPHLFLHSGYSTQTWVHQQQLVAAQQYSHLQEEDTAEECFHNHMQQLLPRAAEQNSCASSPGISQRQDVDKKHDEEFSSLTLDIHHSIHQLNQLILDLDPTFVPISTKPSCLSRAGGADTQTLQTGSLSALVCQHSITPLALPCKLIIPDRDPLEDAVSASPQSITNSAAELLKQGAACNVWFLGSVEMESLTGFQAVQKATAAVLSTDSLPSSTAVHFKVSSQGLTLTDNQRK